MKLDVIVTLDILEYDPYRSWLLALPADSVVGPDEHRPETRARFFPNLASRKADPSVSIGLPS